MKIHEKYILRCIQIAKNGLGSTFPNPMVGAVIVHNNTIIGEGFTSPYGGSHAEVNAINSVKDKTLLSKASLYVTLEPCSHYGKTPPCADLIVKHKIPNVIISLTDPHEKVAGAGIKKLENAGCNVITGVLEKECREHHKRFLCFYEKKRPYIILKWAETNDGFIAPLKSKRNINPEPFWITTKASRQLVHQWRSQEQGILVGTNTVLEDNPKLDVRNWYGKAPTRIIIDRNLKIKVNKNILDLSVKTIVITSKLDKEKQVDGVFYEPIDFKKPIAKEINNILYKHSILSVIIEGGSKTLQTFINENLWDEARVFKGISTFKEGITAPKLAEKLKANTNIKTDTLNIYYND
ncbi:bifunctional diaminohydroxyphosphoribosylaminopyrimidine deaminase/5-amino-6-(5-phosphoribosylamino)uracil reductase RibD [Cellulophaga fucicola]|uniref:Riboflavin biosynthesis protein RibD n=1 Tax=Cellulophaga fucicola TaxID=76595 RepID=A0A1K1MVN2_9FLAO|nr:bifunctional diaminohydroxyphosphoribosylaminopyrimidine deaminase/5-amino-6-(5-phosphoribosylamino)uracil reductase RibD [Cellulophaga fucicola]SFW27167.1 diaminohydroxyphosphoribosylaminopyrimidine deaminase [Cellulophaga fucicola]